MYILHNKGSSKKSSLSSVLRTLYFCVFYMKIKSTHTVLFCQAPKDHVLKLQFVGDFGTYCISRSCFHWVEVKYKADLGLEGPR